MKCVLVLLFCILAVAFSAPSPAQLSLMGNRYTFDMWLAEFMPHQFLQIDATNYVKKRKVFESNLKTIFAHNMKKSSYKMGINQWTAFTAEELTSVLGMDRSAMNKHQGSLRSELKTVDLRALPTEVDWADESKVLNQGSCGSCWAFAASAAINYAGGFNGTQGTGMQALVSCMPNPSKCGGVGGCHGATSELAYDFAVTHGLPTLENYPYTSGTTREDGDCMAYKPSITVSGFIQLKDNSRDELMTAVARGPVSVSVDASKWHMYSSGVLDDCAASDNTVTINHAVLLVGYGFDERLQEHYWKVQNSWSNTWGENGFIRLRREPINSQEECRVDPKPSSGFACDGETEPITVCGCSGVLSRSSYPVGVRRVY